jgi:hypothetical protein
MSLHRFCENNPDSGGRSSSAITLLNRDYFIYTQGEAVFFHSRW